MAPFLRNFFHRHHYYCDESGGNDEKQKWTQTAADDQQRISAFNWRGICQCNDLRKESGV